MYVLGINHKIAPIDIREQFYLTPNEQAIFLCELKSHPEVLEAFIISTCNRTEIYIRLLENNSDIHFLIDLIVKIKKIPKKTLLEDYFYIYTHQEAIRHFMMVACGLDSLVIGEKQILGQVKTSVERARNYNMLGKHFNILSNTAIRAGKKAQTETAICHGGSSVSWAAISLAEKYFDSLKGKKALVLGAGKMGEIALNHLHQKGLKQLFLMNRTVEKAKHFAQQYDCTVADYSDIKEVLTEVDVCFCSTGARHFVVDIPLIEKIMPMRQFRDLYLIDISMPRNINPQVQKIDGIILAGIDDLDRVVKQSMRRRQEAINDVEKIIDQKIVEFARKIHKTEQYSSDERFVEHAKV